MFFAIVINIAEFKIYLVKFIFSLDLKKTLKIQYMLNHRVFGPSVSYIFSGRLCMIFCMFFLTDIDMILCF